VTAALASALRVGVLTRTMSLSLLDIRESQIQNACTRSPSWKWEVNLVKREGIKRRDEMVDVNTKDESQGGQVICNYVRN
jgi:hypothetical protein